MKKRLFSLCICMLLCLSLLPVSASAEYHDYWIDRIETVRYDLNGGYILVQKASEYNTGANNQIVYASPDLAGDVVLPEEVEGVPVTGIYVYLSGSADGWIDNEAYGFNHCDKITSLTIPGTIKTVKAISFPAADGCTVILEEGVESLSSKEGLQYCRIEKLVLPKSLKEFTDGRFEKSPKLTIELNPENPYFMIGEQGLMMTKDGKTVVAATRSGEEVKRYIIPYGVEEIHDGIFRRCPALTDVYFPDTVTRDPFFYYGFLFGLEGKRLHGKSGGLIEIVVNDNNKLWWNKHIEFVPTGEKLPYTDVGTGWAVPYIEWAYETGAMTGTKETTFSPSKAVTRGMAVTTLQRLSEEESGFEHPFTDVAGSAYYSEAVSWAAENKVVNGISDTLFAPGKNITREQLAVMLYRYAEYLEMDTSKRADLSKYTDAGSISAYALTAMQWANAEGIIGGRSETALSPKGVTTRDEYAAVLQRLVGDIK